METPFDPKLKEAMEEMKAVMTKYEIAGSILLTSPTHTEFLYSFEAPWSVIKQGPKGAMVFRSKKEDFPDKETQEFKTSASAHLLTSTFEFHRRGYQMIGGVIEQISEKMGINWKQWSDTPDDQKATGGHEY